MEDTRDHHHYHSFSLQGFHEGESGVMPLSPDEAEFLQILQQVLNGLNSDRSRGTYKSSSLPFFSWLREHGYTIRTLKRKEALEYRAWIFSQETGYAKSTGNRLLTVAHCIVKEYKRSRLIPDDPFEDIKGEPTVDESPHMALTKEQAQALLALPDRSQPMGSRDYAILLVLMKTGMRRGECAGLHLEDITMEQGVHVAWITRKGGARDLVVLRPEVFLAIKDYLELCKRQDVSPQAPLFVQCDAGRHPTEKPLSGDGIYHIVKTYAHILNLPPQPGGRTFTPHGGRASAITFLLEAGVPWEKIMETTGHKRADTMLRYRGRRNKLKDSAVNALDF